MLGFIAALIAGFVTPHIEVPLVRPLVRKIAPHMRIEEAEVRMVSFAVMMLIAGLIAALLHSASAFWVILGGVLGYFALRLVEAARQTLEQRRR